MFQFVVQGRREINMYIFCGHLNKPLPLILQRTLHKNGFWAFFTDFDGYLLVVKNLICRRYRTFRQTCGHEQLMSVFWGLPKKNV